MASKDIKDTMALYEKEARELGISYGTYMAYKETGYLETFKRAHEKEEKKKKLSKRKDTIIYSNIIGA